MMRSNTGHGFTRALLAAALCGTAMLSADIAQAAQGPGIGMGTASHLTQVMMALVVYGMSGAVIAAGLIGAVRGR